MKIAAAYIRVSTDDQTELSPDSQIKQIREFAKKNDMFVPDEYIFADEGISGKNTKNRPGFNRMIGVAKTKPKPFDCILLWKFSRFARNREDSILYKSMLRKQLGIDVISISENIGDDKMSILIEALIEAMDEYYSINLSEEVKRGMLEKVNRGGLVSSAPFGYKVENGQYVIDENNAVYVQMIFDDFINGFGYREIATKLNNMGVTTIRGNHFENRTVEYIIKNPVYIGKIRWNPDYKSKRNDESNSILITDGTHKPIIDKATFDIAQIHASKIKKMYSKYTRSKPCNPFMLQGFVKCSNCGGSLVRCTNESLQCHNYAKGRCGVSHGITINKINNMAFSLIEKTLINGDFTLISQTQKTKFDDCDVQIEKEYEKLERIKLAYQYGIDSIDEYKTNKRRILETIQHLKSKKSIKPNQSEKQPFISQRKNMFTLLKEEAISQEEKNKLLRCFVEKMIFDRTNSSIQIFYYI